MRIGHRCACGHGDLSHKTSSSGKRSCDCQPCGRRCSRNETPELLPTFDARGNRVERIIPPGEKLATEGDSGPLTCGCEDCKALYAEVTGVELEPAPA